MIKGLVFDIKEGAVHDGPGLRTTVFLKGCLLRCVWCHNPEGLEKRKELLYKQNLCTNCGECKKVCDHDECAPFSRCVKSCANGALNISGKYFSPQELCDVLSKNKCFYDVSGGGVTFSGGEPLMQSEFLYDCLCILKDKGISTCIETSGYADNGVFEKILTKLDFVIMDIKLFDEKEHKKYTGVDNRIILNNARHLMKSHLPHLFRTPLIPGICDTKENLSAIGEFVGTSPWEKIKYNELAELKYKMVGKEFSFTVQEE